MVDRHNIFSRFNHMSFNTQCVVYIREYYIDIVSIAHSIFLSLNKIHSHKNFLYTLHCKGRI